MLRPPSERPPSRLVVEAAAMIERMKKRVYMIYTGGTIGMRRTADGYSPEPGLLQHQMRAMSELKDASMPAVTVHEYGPLIDSSNMTPIEWMKIADDIANNYDDYDGFIVLHGTDTMAYTASALSFILDGLRKPVIVTGSQIPLSELRSDGHDNLINSLVVASSLDVPEVCLYFGNKLLRGCRTVKVSANGFAPFSSPNFPPLGSMGVGIEIRWDLVRRPSKNKRFSVRRMDAPVLSALRLFPGISVEFVRNVLRPPLQGLVLQAYGVGNGPGQNQEFVETIAEATRRGVVIVDCTQCLQGAVDLGEYAAGSALAKAGVISGYDMTVEAALTKLNLLFSQGYKPERVRRDMCRDLRGEMTVPN